MQGTTALPCAPFNQCYKTFQRGDYEDKLSLVRQWSNKSQGTCVSSRGHFLSSNLEYKNVVQVLWWLACVCGMTSESLLPVASVSGKSDSGAALNVSVVGYSTWILSKTKQSDFLMQFSWMQLLMMSVGIERHNIKCPQIRGVFHLGRRSNRRSPHHW